jgi:hypothetical protein
MTSRFWREEAPEIVYTPFFVGRGKAQRAWANVMGLESLRSCERG